MKQLNPLTMLISLCASLMNSLKQFGQSAFVKASLWIVTLGILLSPASAQAQLASYDGTNITFDPSVVATPVTNGAIGAVIAGSTLVILGVVIGWIFSYVRRR